MGVAFIYPAWPTCLIVYVQKSDFHLINLFCVVFVVKQRKLLILVQVILSYFLLHSNKIPLVFTTKVTHLGSLLFRQPDGVNSVVRSLFCGVSQNRVVQSVA